MCLHEIPAIVNESVYCRGRVKTLAWLVELLEKKTLFMKQVWKIPLGFVMLMDCGKKLHLAESLNVKLNYLSKRIIKWTDKSSSAAALLSPSVIILIK